MGRRNGRRARARVGPGRFGARGKRQSGMPYLASPAWHGPGGGEIGPNAPVAGAAERRRWNSVRWAMRIRFLLAGILGAVIAVTGCATTGGTSGTPPRPHPAPSPRATTTAPPPRAAPGSPLRPPLSPARPPATVLELGDAGPAVVTLQTRLNRLAYWLRGGARPPGRPPHPGRRLRTEDRGRADQGSAAPRAVIRRASHRDQPDLGPAAHRERRQGL